MAFSDRGSLLQAPPNLYKVLLAFSQPPVAYVVAFLRAPLCPLLKNPKEFNRSTCSEMIE
ncbi:hypothetical protein RYX36_004811 [Vicia faba]